jgi:hypothetical protein
VNLDRRVGALDGGFGRVQLGDRGLGGVGLTGVLEIARPPDKHPGGVGLDRHVGDHRLDQLKAGDRTPELLAVLGVAHRGLHAALTDPDAAGRDAVSPGVQRAHRDLEAVAHLSQQLILGHLDVVERDRGRVRAAQAHLVVDLLRLESRLIGLDQEAGESTVALLGVGLGEDQRQLGVVAQRDPHLGAVNHPAGVGAARAGALIGRVRARVGLGEPEAPQPFARAQLGQVSLLLLVGPPAQKRRADQRGLH